MELQGIVFWYWFVAGLVFFSLEALMPGAIFIWMGVSAVVVGALAWVLPLGWKFEFVLFGVLSIASFFAYRKFRREPASDKPTLNRRGQSYIGRVFTLAAPIVNGIGKVHVDDSQWRIAGPDLPAGAQVKVVDADGTTLKVEAAH